MPCASSAASADSFDASCCPLCGQANQCAVAAGDAPESCWCMHTPIAAAALQRLPPAERGRRCICAHCAQPTDAPPPHAAPL
ncbi:MAG: cysteine-rich CWC family protein [Acidovorax sp.]|nr:cysteine-rich CWC family protein [Acidovorax sp.]